MFFILPVGVDYRARRYPVVTFTVMGICVLVYLVQLFAEASHDSETVRDWVFDNLWLIPGEAHWWNYLTHQFVHGGFFHLAGNMIYLFLFGACCEDLIGRVHFAFFYLLCGVLAALTYVFMATDVAAISIPMGGASGAISGCIGGFFILLAGTKIEFKWGIFLGFRGISGDFFLPAWIVISFWFLEDFVAMVLRAMNHHHHGGGVAFAAHVGGTLFGVGLMTLEKMRLKRLPPEVEEEEDEVEVVVRPPLTPTPRPRTEVRRFTLPGVTAPAMLSAESEPQASVVTAQKEPVDPLATIHLSTGGVQSGPFTFAKIQEMFRAKEIPAEALYWQEGMDEWRGAEELREPGQA